MKKTVQQLFLLTLLIAIFGSSYLYGQTGKPPEIQKFLNNVKHHQDFDSPNTFTQILTDENFKTTMKAGNLVMREAWNYIPWNDYQSVEESDNVDEDYKTTLFVMKFYSDATFAKSIGNEINNGKYNKINFIILKKNKSEFLKVIADWEKKMEDEEEE